MFYIVLFITKVSQILIKIIGRNASYFPGKIAVTLYPDFLKKIDKPKIIIGVTGTNGKTTVCNLLVNFFEANNYKVLDNKYGTNVNSGIASSFIKGVSFFNKSKYDYAVLEIDERSFPKVLPYIKLDYLVCTNLFRDSIRRNAHSEFIFDIINNSLNDDIKLILNADDIISSSLGNKNKKVYFGIDKLDTDLKESINIINDARICPKCYEKLTYEYVKYHHIGKAYCPKCGFKSKDANYLIKKIDYDNKEITVLSNGKKQKYHLISDSLYNIYNEITIVSLLSELNIEENKIEGFLKNCVIVESRLKEETINGISVISHMAKGQNAIACSCVFDYVSKKENKKEVVLMLYDHFDARASSENLTWIYDTDFELLNNPLIEKIIVYGPRAKDFKLRLLLANVDKNKVSTAKNYNDVINSLSFKKDKDIYILFELYDEKDATELRKKIIDKIKGGKS